MNLPIELETAFVVFVAVVAAQLGKAGLRMLQSFVKGTKTNLDDKILAAVTTGLRETYVVQIVDHHGNAHRAPSIVQTVPLNWEG